MKKNALTWILPLSLILVSCNFPAHQPAATATASHTPGSLPSATLAATFSPSPTLTPSITPTATLTPSPTITKTPSITPTPTFAFPSVTVNQQAHCRYGPAKAHLHAADLYPGDTGSVRGRFQYSKWLYVKFDKLNYFCWVAPSVVDVVGNVDSLYYAEVKLPGPSICYNAPETVSATRNGDKVTITWSQVKMTSDKDRGYYLELFVCQDGGYLWWPISFPDQSTTSYTVKDEKGCPAPSGGVIYTVEKHGYSLPKTIVWPPLP